MVREVQRVRALTSAVGGDVYRDGGILDFGREHIFLDTLLDCEIVLPQGLVTFISAQAIKEFVKEYSKGSEQHGDGAAGGDSDTGDGQAGHGQEGDADSAGVVGREYRYGADFH